MFTEPPPLPHHFLDTSVICIGPPSYPVMVMNAQRRQEFIL